MRFYLLTFFAFFLTGHLIAQKIVKGIIRDQSTKKGIPFCNVGIMGSPVGSISNEDGSFLVVIPGVYESDSLTISALGFGKRVIPVNELSSARRINFYLAEKVTQLGEVDIVAKSEKRKTYSLGNRLSRGGSFLLADSLAAGSALALLIENKFPAYYPDLHFPVYVESAKLRIFKNTLDEFKVRVRLLEVDTATQLPGKDLIDQSIVVTGNIKSGWLQFDLSQYNIKISRNSFFLVFEWIMDDTYRLKLLDQFANYRKLNPGKVTRDTALVRGEKVAYTNYHGVLFGTNFAVSAIQFSLDNYKTYARLNSFGRWEKAPAILTARIEVSNRPKDLHGKSPVAKAENQPANCAEQTPVCSTINLCESFLEDNAVNGIQLTVSEQGRIVLSRGFGFSDIDNSKAVTDQTQFRIGSVSKSLTSAALVKLVSEGKLDLDAPVQKYVPSFPEKKYKLTTRQLAGHLAGMRHYDETNTNELMPHAHFANATEAISLFKNDTLLSRPGTEYHYSSYGWNLIGAVIEGASRENYVDYMKNKIWAPLGMIHTCPDVIDSVIANKSKFYLLTGEEAEKYDLSYKYPSGGLLSTTDDLVRFGNELLNGDYFNAAVKKSLFDAQLTSQNQNTHYGLGWNTGKDENGHRIYFHAGNLPEGSAYLILYPDDNIVVAFLANSQEGINFKIQKIGELFYQK